MQIAVLKSFYDEAAGTTETPSEYTLSGDYYLRTWTVDRASLTLVDELDGNEVDPSVCVDDNGAPVCNSEQICLRDTGSSTYSCQETVSKINQKLPIFNLPVFIETIQGQRCSLQENCGN